MTALEREMAADAVALAKEHADRADRAEARLAGIASHCRERLNGAVRTGRHGLSMAAARHILSLAEGNAEEETRDG